MNFTCPICQRTFNSQSSYDYHMVVGCTTVNYQKTEEPEEKSPWRKKGVSQSVQDETISPPGTNPADLLAQSPGPTIPSGPLETVIKSEAVECDRNLDSNDGELVINENSGLAENGEKNSGNPEPSSMGETESADQSEPPKCPKFRIVRREFNCDFCGKEFRDDRSLQQHMHTHIRQGFGDMEWGSSGALARYDH